MWSTHSRRIEPINRSAKCVLPRRSGSNRLVPDAHGAQSTCDDGAKDAVPIANEVVRSLIPGTCLSYLARDPFRRRMSCDVDPDEISTIQPDDDEGVEQLEVDRRDDEHIHRGDVRGMIAQKGAHPWLGGPRRLTMYLATFD